MSPVLSESQHPNQRENCTRRVKQARETLFETLVIEERDLNITLLEQQRGRWQGPGELWG